MTVPIPTSVLEWRALAEKYASVQGGIISANEILAIIWTESSGKSKATNPNDPSWGLMQITLPIGRQFADVITDEDLYDPDKNVQAGSGFLAYLKHRYSAKFPNYAWVAGYNEGEGALLRGEIDQNYVAAFRIHLQTLDDLDSSPDAT